MSNENCLKGIKCPKCGNESEFIIQANAVVTVEDSGVTDAHTFEWESDAGCGCAACDFHGELSEFETDGETDGTAPSLVAGRERDDGCEHGVMDGTCVNCTDPLRGL